MTGRSPRTQKASLWVAAAILFAASSSPSFASESRRWEEARQRDTIEAYVEYLDGKTTPRHRDEARARLRALRYEQALAAPSLDAYDRFIRDHPDTPEAQAISERRAELVKELAEKKRAEQARQFDESAYGRFERDRRLDTACSYLQQQPDGVHRAEVLAWLASNPGLMLVPEMKLYVTVIADKSLPGVWVDTDRATLDPTRGFGIIQARVAPRRGQQITMLTLGLVNVGPAFELRPSDVEIIDRAGVGHPALGWGFENDRTTRQNAEILGSSQHADIAFMLPAGDVNAMTLAIRGRKIASLQALRRGPPKQ